MLKIKVHGDASGFEMTMAKVRGQAAMAMRSIGAGIGGRLAGLVALGGIEHTIRSTLDYAGALTDMSARTGVAVESLQRLDRAARDNGSNLESLVGFWERVGAARALALKDPNSSDAKAFKALGVDQATLKKGSGDDITRQISVAFQNTTNVDELLTPLRELAGRGAGQMVALLRAGYDQQYEDMQVMTGAQADLLDELGDKWESLGQRISIGVTPILIKLIDAWVYVQDKLTSFFTAMMVGNDTPLGDGGDARRKAYKDAYEQSEAENREAREKEKSAREKRVRERLKFGDTNLDIEAKAAKEKWAVKDKELDSLSKAGLFAGGAGSKMANNIPEKTLAATEKIVAEVRRTNDTLEDKL